MLDEIKSGLRKFLGSLFFVGYIPWFSSTTAALLMIALLWFKRGFFAEALVPENMQEVLFFLIISLALASWLCEKSEASFGSYNGSPLILDVFLGQFIVFLFVPISLETLALGFVLYRLFGIIKPWPIFHFDEIEGGVGIVMDDVIAAVAAAISLQGVLFVYGAIIGYLR